MKDILFSTGKEIVEANHVIASFEQALAKMAAEKTSSAGNKNRTHY